MVKTIAITTLSFSALLFNGYTNHIPSQGKNAHLQNLQHSSGNVKTATDTLGLKAGDKCPDIVFRDTTGYNGHDVKLSSFKGKYVLIDVWASWCAPCRAQYPHLVLLENKMKNKEIVFVSISIDTRVFRWKGPALQSMGGIQWMVKDEGFEKAFGITTIPRFILLDKKGNVLNPKMPLPSHPELEQELNKLKGI
ncbi:thiol-disulfide isomerase/thioredoxin [Mucilaginibacter gracilis]|uniref:Thiol-disulfide isomerase/thioredoxin n=1 Tax=Mucilaginibacter gracilis TaxID=423350 RepID=A0A495IYM9_9SPHI|nr:TlpA disulfide reductase family protein [Mucilaginibacter gracilis]RKR81797.1 thiol-disulfide isomerase/thioredoxin [Mucilaginibacter gracilis]